ncbi:hypothetical protein ACHAXT_001481 [Thalassiosira profunda]
MAAVGKPNNSRQRRKLAYRCRHRLLSIERDATNLKERVLSILAEEGCTVVDVDGTGSWPWLPNKHCGSWYLPPDDASTFANRPEVYFKSTDGHLGTYNVSLKRLNLCLLEVLHRHGGCFLIDSSVRKVLPDSFSRTIPIWCCVINRLVLRYRAELGLDGSCNNCDAGEWDVELHTPASIVSPEEHLEISSLIESRVELLYQSKAVVDPKRLVQIATKPVRAVWAANGALQNDTVIPSKCNADKFHTIVCCNPSRYFEGSSAKNHVHWVNRNGEDGSSDRGYFYTPGAADDHNSWGRGLTPEIFWAHREKIQMILDASKTDDETDALVDDIVSEWNRQQTAGEPHQQSTSNADKIGDLNLWVGSRRAGRPPECWDSFDAILNVTETEYSDMQQSMKEKKKHNTCCYYLQLPVAEGKRDKSDLERWMPVGLAFLIEHLQQKRRILLHCAQGRDRSIATAIAFVALFCLPRYPLRLKPEFETIDMKTLVEIEIDADEDEGLSYLQSGLSQTLVDALLKESGKDVFLMGLHQQLEVSSNESFANKDSLRIVLHLIRQDREIAEPTRSTLQKVNRFFMSSSLYMPGNASF